MSQAGGRGDVVDAIERQVRDARTGGFDIDATVDTEVAMPARAPSPVAMKDLDRVIASPDLMPPGTDIQPLGRREYGLLSPGMRERLRVTTDPAYYEEHSESVELWSPGNPLFTSPEFIVEVKDDALLAERTLGELLENQARRQHEARRSKRSHRTADAGRIPLEPAPSRRCHSFAKRNTTRSVGALQPARIVAPEPS